MGGGEAMFCFADGRRSRVLSSKRGRFCFFTMHSLPCRFVCLGSRRRLTRSFYRGGIVCVVLWCSTQHTYNGRGCPFGVLFTAWNTLIGWYVTLQTTETPLNFAPGVLCGISFFPGSSKHPVFSLPLSGCIVLCTT